MKTTNKTAYAFVAICLALLLGYLVSGPFITMYAIKSGIEQKDTEKLSRNIDFPILRENLKSQSRELIEIHFSDSADSNNDLLAEGFESLAVNFISEIMNHLIDSYITPPGLIKLTSDQPLEEESSKLLDEDYKDELVNGANNSVKNLDSLEATNFSFDSDSRFSIYVSYGESPEEELQIQLARRGLKWILINVQISIDYYKTEAKKKTAETALMKAAIEGQADAVEYVNQSRRSRTVTDICSKGLRT